MTEPTRCTGDPELTVRAALARHPAVRRLADAPLTVLRGGLGNHAWLAAQQGLRCFVRLGAANAADFGIDRTSECRLLEVVAAAGLAPRLIACEPAAGLLVTEYIDGSHLSADDAGRKVNLRRIGRLLRRLHDLPLPRRLHEVSFATQALNLSRQLVVADAADGEDAALYNRAQRCFANLARRTARLAICHNDVHHLNVIEGGGRLWLVDWEYGGTGDPLFDLAGFLCQHDFDARQRAVFLDAYGPVPGADDAALDHACWAFDYVRWLWYRLWLRDRPDRDGIHAQQVARLARRLLRCNNAPLDAGRG